MQQLSNNVEFLVTLLNIQNHSHHVNCRLALCFLVFLSQFTRQDNPFESCRSAATWLSVPIKLQKWCKTSHGPSFLCALQIYHGSKALFFYPSLNYHRVLFPCQSVDFSRATFVGSLASQRFFWVVVPSFQALVTAELLILYLTRLYSQR